MKKTISLFLSLLLLLSLTALPVLAEPGKTQARSFEEYLKAVKEYDGALEDILFDYSYCVPIYELYTADIIGQSYRPGYYVSREAFEDFSNINSYQRFYLAMNACSGWDRPKTADELRRYHWYRTG